MKELIGPLLTRPDFTYAQLEPDVLRPVQQEQAEGFLELLRSLSERVSVLESGCKHPAQTSGDHRSAEDGIDAPESVITDIASPTEDRPISTPQVEALEDQTIQTSTDLSAKSLRLKDLSVGDVFSLGSWQGKPIEWKILEWRHGTLGSFALVISKYALCERPYHNAGTKVSWDTCELHTWLVQEIYSHSLWGLGSEWQAGEDWPTDEDKNEYGYVFLLSVSEAAQYLPTVQSKRCKLVTGAETEWWLRSDDKRKRAPCVDIYGAIDVWGCNCQLNMGVRPAMWLREDTPIAPDSICESGEEKV